MVISVDPRSDHDIIFRTLLISERFGLQPKFDVSPNGMAINTKTGKAVEPDNQPARFIVSLPSLQATALAAPVQYFDFKKKLPPDCSTRPKFSPIT